MNKKWKLIGKLSILAFVSASVMSGLGLMVLSKTITAENPDNSSQIQKNHTKQLRNNQAGSAWNEENVDGDTKRRVVVYASSDAQLRDLYPYQLVENNLFGVVQEILFQNINDIFTGPPMQNPSPSQFEIWPEDILINNREGWVDLTVSKIGYYSPDTGEWKADGRLTAIVRIQDFKRALPTPERLQIKIINGQPYKPNIYPFEFVNEANRLFNGSDNDAFFNYMNRFIQDFEINRFPFTDFHNEMQINFDNLDAINNVDGTFNLQLNYSGVFLNDQYCTYEPRNISSNLEMQFAKKGITDFSNGMVIDFSKSLVNGVQSGTAIFGNITAVEFIDNIVNNDSSSVNWLRDQFWEIIVNPYVATDDELSKTNINFSRTFTDYDISHGEGSVILAGDLENLYITKNELISSLRFGKGTKYNIILTGFDQQANTKIIKNSNYPLIDLNTNIPLRPSVALSKLKETINLSWSDNTNIAKQFFQVLNPPENLENFSIKNIEGRADDATGVLEITRLEFNNALINGEYTDLTVDTSDGKFTYEFPQIAVNSTSIVPQMYVDRSLSNLYPYEFDSNSSQNISSLKNILIENGIIDPPSDVYESARPIDENDLVIEQVNNETNNLQGSITVNVKLKYYINDNGDLIDNASTPLSQRVQFTGFKFTNATSVNRNIDYTSEFANVYPFQLLEEDFWNGANDYEKILKFFSIYWLPHTSYNNDGSIKENCIQNFRVDEVENLQGTALISFDIVNGYFEDNEKATFNPGNKHVSMQFNFFKRSRETEFKSEIYLSNVADYTVSQFVKILQEDTTSSTAQAKMLKNELFNNGILNTECVPPGVDSTNLLDWIQLESYELSTESDINKSFELTFSVNSWFNETGTLEPNASSQSQTKQFTITVNGNFKDVTNTRFKNGATYNVNFADISAEVWLNNHSLIEEYIVNNWENLQMLEGDVPINFNMQDNLIIKGIPDSSVSSGWIQVDVSLKSYYQNNELVQNDVDGYDETTIITLTGFSSEEPTSFPETTDSPFNVNHSNDLLSSIYAGYIDSNLQWSEEQWKSFILSEIVQGSKRNMTVDNITDFQINRIDDKRGLVSFNFRLTKYYNENRTLVEEGDPEYDMDKATATNIIIGGFKTQNPTVFTNSRVALKYPSRVAEFFFDENNNASFWQKLMDSNAITQYNVYGYNFENYILNMSKNSGVLFDNHNGTITFKDVSLSQYYDNYFALPANANQFSVNVPANQTNFTQYPYPESITDTITEDYQPQTPVSDVQFSGFKQITEPTGFNASTEYEYDQNSKFIIEKWSTVKIIEAIAVENSPEQEEFKRFLFDNVVSGTKNGISYEDITIDITDNSYKNGTITLSISLNKYWDENLNFVDSMNTQHPPLTSHIFTIKGFSKIQDTVIQSGTWKATGNIANYKPSDLLSILENNENDSFKSFIISNIVNQCIKGNVSDGISRPDNINLIFTDAVKNDIDGQLTIKFSLNQKWAGGAIVPAGDTEYTFTITDLSKIVLTSCTDPVNLNSYYADPNTYTYFNVSQITAESFLNNGYDGKNFTDVVRDLYESQHNLLVMNVYNDEVPNITGYHGELSDDRNSIILSFTINNAWILTADGSSNIMGTKFCEVTLTGFKEIATGPTRFIQRSTIPISGELANLVNLAEEQITADEFSKEIKNNNNRYTAVLKQFIWDNFINHNSNIERLDWQSIELVTDTSSGNAFSGEYKITFYLKNYWNNDGVFVSNQNYEQAKVDLMFKNITITNFPKKQNTSNEPTIAITGDRIAISAVRIDPNNPEIVDDTLMSIVPTNIDLPANKELFKAWIMQNLYTGNLEGLVNNSIEDGNNVDIIRCVPNNEKGEIVIEVRLRSYYTDTGIAENGLLKTITVYGFKKVNATTANKGPFNLVSDTSLPITADPNNKNFKTAYNLIKENRVEIFVNETSNSEQNKTYVEQYIREWLVLNREMVFEFLPENMSNDELRNAISFNTDFNNNLAWRAGRDNTLTVSINLLKYQNKDGNIIVVTDENNELPLSLQITFNGFLDAGKPTWLTNNMHIWVSEQSNKPWFLSQLNGLNYYDLQANELFIGEDLNPSASETIKRIILAKPNKDKDESSGNYESLINGRTQNIGASNINIIKAKPLNTLGRIQIDYEVLNTWTKDDIELPTGRLSGSLTLEGFKIVSINVQLQKGITPFVLGGVGGGVFLLFAIIAFVVFYRRRKDIEYQQ